MTGSNNGYVKVVLHNEHGRVPETIVLTIPEVIRPEEMLERLNKLFGDCKRVGGLYGLMSLINEAATVNNDDHRESDPEYTYRVSTYLEATISGATDTEVTINNHVDEPFTENLGSLSAERAASLA
jgi:hypothetical protein